MNIHNVVFVSSCKFSYYHRKVKHRRNIMGCLYKLVLELHMFIATLLHLKAIDQIFTAHICKIKT